MNTGNTKMTNLLKCQALVKSNYMACWIALVIFIEASLDSLRLTSTQRLTKSREARLVNQAQMQGAQVLLQVSLLMNY